ncbi:MAG: hypothetical protein K6G56_03285 [Clostridiales bacterium]|nr:hypothetical protein [Clostridiales bacterium]
MAEKKKRSKRRSYLNDFHQDVTGEFRYTGKHHLYAGEYSGKKVRLLTALLTAALVLAAAGVGFIPAPSMTEQGVFYVLLPYIGELIAVFVTAWASLMLLRPVGSDGEKLRLRAYTFERSIGRLPHRTVIAAVLAGACVIANVVFICIRGFEGKPVMSIAVILLHIAAGAFAILLKRFAASLEFTEDGGEADAFRESEEIENDPAPEE